MGLGELLFCTSVLALGVYRLGFATGALQTLAFVVIVFGNQATTYTNRERRHLWSSRPTIVALIAGILILLIPRLLNLIVAIYLILMGISGLWPSLHLAH